ncbi:MAG: M24 family metallopeptidase [Clostridiales bacterium]|nr:M24 family metallopeptidase [Clostridiales bacterium]
MTASEKVSTLRAEMRKRNVTCLLVPSDDCHQSEYVCDYFKSRAYISGFSGSAGTLIISLDGAWLFTDGRYYIQAERQLAGSGIELMRSGSEGVPTPEEFLVSKLQSGDTLAYDAKCVSAKFAEGLQKKLAEGVKIVGDVDFPALIWADRPDIAHGDIWQLDEKYSGKSHTDKLADVRKVLSEKKCGALVMSSLCDIAWLYNLRGSDVKNTPVFMSYCIITENSDTLYVNADTASISDAMKAEGVTLRTYNEFYDDLKQLKDISVLIDKSAVNAAIVESLSGCKIVNDANPTLLMKAKKNPVELENLLKCHVADGLAVTRLMLELKFGEREFDEMSVDKYLYSLRRECADRVGVTLLDESFGTIAAFGANAAMMHYSATPIDPDSETPEYVKLDKNAPVPMLLVDSGGQYLEGTTDITRTFVLGNISDEIKQHYTLTACGMLRLLNLVFLDGASGSSLDIVCREPLWEIGVDYRCGTGHGVGYLLSVHEGPNRFHWRTGAAKIEEGMITTDEPGVYVEGSHGIRIENELAAVKGEHNEYGQFMRFENLTFCPIDLDGIDAAYLDKSDIRKLNAYHRTVFDTLSPYLCEKDRGHLEYLCREIK